MKLLEKYSENFHRVLAHHGRTLVAEDGSGESTPYTGLYYVCPLCLISFPGDSVKPNSPLLTEEHNPPAQYGGRGVILTCRECNSASGSTRDPLVGQLVNYLPFIRSVPGSHFRAKVRIGHMTVKAHIQNTELGKKNIVIDRSNPPYVLKALRTAAEKQRMSFELTMKPLSVANAQKGYLKMAHLEACRYFGMSYLFTENARRIVESLRTERQWVLNDGLLSDPLPLPSSGLHIMNVTGVCRAYLMVVQLELSNASVRMGTLIPGPGEGGWSDYLKCNALLNREVKMQCSHYTNVGLPRRQVSPDAYGHIWRKHFNL